MTTHRTYSGKEVRVKHSNIKARARFQLDFPALPTAEMLEIIAHYRKQKGGFASFTIPDAVANAMDFPADFTPAGNEWIYIGKPRVADIPLPGGSPSNCHNVTVDIESVPATSTTILPRFRWRLRALPPVVASAFVDVPASGFTMESLAPVARNSFPALAFPPTTGFTLTGLIPVVVSDPSPFDPLDLAPVGWWDASDPGTVTTSGGEIVSWDDKSGNGFDMGTESDKRPAYETNAINGLNAAKWPPSDNSEYVGAGGTFAFKEVYIVLQYTGGSTFSNFDGIFTTFSNAWYISGGAGGATGLQVLSGTEAYVNENSIDNRVENVFPEIANVCLLRVTSATTRSSTTGVGIGMDRANTPLARGWSGYIGEVIAFADQLDEADRNKVVRYLVDKWDIDTTPG
jgi:hypothetical protein